MFTTSSIMNEKQYIFVYGSLLERGTNYNKIKDEKKLKKLDIVLLNNKTCKNSKKMYYL